MTPIEEEIVFNLSKEFKVQFVKTSSGCARVDFHINWEDEDPRMLFSSIITKKWGGCSFKNDPASDSDILDRKKHLSTLSTV
jgi:hypothetical protein